MGKNLLFIYINGPGAYIFRIEYSDWLKTKVWDCLNLIISG